MAVIGSYPLIIAGCLIILLSFIFTKIANKTNVPAVLMLIGLGVFIQYGLKLMKIPEIDFFPILEVIGIIGLIMIVLEAALELELKKEKIKIILKSLLIAALGLGLSLLAAAGIIFYLIPEMDWYTAMLYATPLSILSSAIIIPSVGNLSEEKKEFHVYESTFSDIIGIMFFYFVLNVIEFQNPDPAAISEVMHPMISFGISISVSVLVAFAASYMLLYIFQFINEGARLFLLISLLVLLYAVGKMLHLSPLIIILVFGVIVQNNELFYQGFLRRYFHKKKFEILKRELHVITMESAFVVRTFFFVIFGASILMSSLFSLKVLGVSLLLLISIYAIRWLFLRAFMGFDIFPQLWIAPRGLITVLLYYAIPQKYSNEFFDSGILLFIIIATSLVMTWGLIRSAKVQDIPLIVNPIIEEETLDEKEFYHDSIP
ncbi:sodium:proton exchanger [Ancylomarina euxinus]|uniref:Sodium:proton exchanger n=1 Tax=Ancylomarina euxinus TaxID=2283627 RepID=A0A425XWP1_9BACT|nr:cation:proton antiporter [Ancylomarina euxinus]MCZ4696373.1 cation:proton antiporter [Ancylomarina euxinus]MUP16780.1 sodium:proton exchanger [Ancylomarina euxinus]RRG19058.1 sodium:proton exchanger [Ancylomarina euxinus]